ncbi:MAG: FlgD immunoglobulin-like domain containing protein [Fidelibacterota bacterium]
MTGRTVKTVVSGFQDAGYKSVVWDATDDQGLPVSAGVYLYQLKAGEFIEVKKMILLR